MFYSKILARCVLGLFGTVIASSASAQLVTTDLDAGLTPTDLVNALIGGDVTVSNITFSGANRAAGIFSGGTGILGFENGIVLSSGDIANVTAVGGLNHFDDITADNGLPGDPDLDALIPGFVTFDATVLEFDFECKTLQVISFQYVFSSDEYNEYVNSPYNDVFGFFLNGVNVALLPDGVTPVSINNVNGGGPAFGDNPSNPAFYINNDCTDLPGAGSFPCVPAVLTEMDGLTVVLTVFAPVNPGLNHIKLAIADAGDRILDSNVFIRGQSFVCAPPGDGCVRSQGYWKNHPGMWPTSELTLGTVVYDQTQLLGILGTPPRGNGLIILAKQLIASKLNQSSGAPVPADVLTAMNVADALIGDLVVPPWGDGFIHPREVSALSSLLDHYNNGKLLGGPPHCDN